MDQELIALAFSDFIRETPELEGLAVIFAATESGGEVITLCGGQHIMETSFNELIMRAAYNVVKGRKEFYRSEHSEIKIVRGATDESES